MLLQLIVMLNFARMKGFEYHLVPNINASQSLIALMEVVFVVGTDLVARWQRMVILKFAGTMGYIQDAKRTMIANMVQVHDIVVPLVK